MCDSRQKPVGGRETCSVPLLSVVLCGEGNTDGKVVTTEALHRVLPERSEIIFSDTRDGGFAHARNRGLGLAKGEFVSFLAIGECYATHSIAEIIVLTAKTFSANIYGGGGALSSFVFKRDWLLANDLRFFGDRGGENLFLETAKILAGLATTTSRQVIAGHTVAAFEEIDVHEVCRAELRSVHEAVEYYARKDSLDVLSAIRRYLMRGKALQFRRLLQPEVPMCLRAADVARMRRIADAADDEFKNIGSRFFAPYADILSDETCRSAIALRQWFAQATGLFVCIGQEPSVSVLSMAAMILDDDANCDAVIVRGGEFTETEFVATVGQLEDILCNDVTFLFRKKFLNGLVRLNGASGIGIRRIVLAWEGILKAKKICVLADDGLCPFNLASEIGTADMAYEMFRAMYAADRLDLAGVFYRILYDAAVKAAWSAETAGMMLNKTGYPYFAALVSQKSRADGVSRALQRWSNAAAGCGFASPGSLGMPKLAGCVSAPGAADGPGLSIIMPVYNAERYLVRSIESVRKQTSLDWELICVDDGSIDGSAGILDFYAAADCRIRVFHKNNSGVSDTRNFGMRQACGNYVAFLDSDDWYEPSLVEEVLSKCRQLDLDACFFDYRCRDHATLRQRYHYWTFAHLGEYWDVQGRVFAAAMLKKWWYYGSLCQIAWKRTFLSVRAAEFPCIPLGEDFVLLSRLFPAIERGFFIEKPLYNYQRGSATSAVTRMGAEKGFAFVQKYEALLSVYRDELAGDAARVARKKFKGRLLSDIVYDSSVAPIVRAWIREKGRIGFELDDIDQEYVLDPAHVTKVRQLLDEPSQVSEVDVGSFVPHREAKLMKIIERRRSQCQHKDLYIVAAQLTSDNDEAIDGWSFFLYLKSIGVPAKFVIWKRHRRCKEFKKAYPGDIIEISDPSDSSYSFLHACEDVLVRAKAVAVEWRIANQAISDWLSRLDGCVYTFLQHGVQFMPPRAVHRKWWVPFNLINVSSDRERDMVREAIQADAGIRYIVSGVMRWDVVKDERDLKDSVVLVMFTWRPSFNIAPESFWSSAYFSGLKALFSAGNLEALKRHGLRVALSIHHSLRKLDGGKLDFGPDVEIVSTQSVSSWIQRASCLITDFSSVSFDFWRMKKPVVYWIPDKYDTCLTAPDQEKVGEACRFLARFVNQVHSAQEAIGMVCRYSKANFALEDDVKRCVRPFFSGYGDCRKRVYEAIERIASEEGK